MAKVPDKKPGGPDEGVTLELGPGGPNGESMPLVPPCAELPLLGQEGGAEVAVQEPIEAPRLLNLEHAHPRIRKIVQHLLANQHVICDFSTGSVEFHWKLNTGREEDESSVKTHIHVYPRA